MFCSRPAPNSADLPTLEQHLRVHCIDLRQSGLGRYRKVSVVAQQWGVPRAAEARGFPTVLAGPNRPADINLGDYQPPSACCQQAKQNPDSLAGRYFWEKRQPCVSIATARCDFR